MTIRSLVGFFRPLLVFSGSYLIISLLLRVALWWAFGRSAAVGLSELPLILLAGVVNDGVELVYLALPFSLYRFMVPGRIFNHPRHRRGLGLIFFFLLFGMLYLSVTEYFFFDEFNSRFNLVAVDYLIYPHEVLINIWDSYPVFRVILGALLVSWLIFKLVRPKSTQNPETLRLRDRGLALAAHGLLVILAATTFSTNTLAFSANRVGNEIGANGISSLFQAFFTNNLDYNRHYRTIEKQRAFSLVRRDLLATGGSPADADQLSLERRFAGSPDGFGKLNVVVIVEESFGAGFVGAYGDQRGLTPNFDRLAESGLLFRNAFATGTRTVRGLEAIAASFPPIPSESIIKRPGSEGIATWGRVMAANGYHTSFLYGGYGYFDNMNHFFAGNGFNISDRSDIAKPTFANIWGVCDEDLFRHALNYFDGVQRQAKPFFSIIMTTSNHKPFSFPSGIPDVPPTGGGRPAGIRYADYALGRFFAEAAQHDWYDRTLFVVVADHDARVYGRAQVPVEHYRIPLLILAPGRIPPKAVEQFVSQLDIAPTVLGLLGFTYTAPFYGQDVLHMATDEHPILLNHNHDVAFIENHAMVVLGLQKTDEGYRYDPRTDDLAPATADPALLDRATAYYQTAFDLFAGHRYQ